MTLCSKNVRKCLEVSEKSIIFAAEPNLIEHEVQSIMHKLG